ncbi:MAG: hypothetical protein KatS3mg017_0914 [Fimbriimonadales bacterium]|nr:MAG: hypothetical protein KatS3mg017_0914 [Fimbriimonadales bacterium]
MLLHRKFWILVVVAVSLIGWIFYGFADPCANNPCQNQGDIEGRRCGLPDCVYVMDQETERLAGRYCFAHHSACRTHTAGNCNHQVDVFCKIKIYRCLHANGTQCRPGTETRELGVSRTQPSWLDCQGHRCRGPGSVITPQPISIPE